MHSAESESVMRSPDALCTAVCAALEDVSGRDVVVLDIRQLSSMADYFVIASGTSSRHVKTLAEEVLDRVTALEIRPLGVEGLEAAEWVLLDLGDVVVHLMSGDARAHYRLEELWDSSQWPAERNDAQ